MIIRLRPHLSRLSLAGLLAPAVWVLSGCASPYPGDRYPPSVQQPTYPYGSQPSYPYGSQTTERRDYRRLPNERLYEANVTSARAVMRSGGQQCWIEREAVAPARSGTNVPGAVAGAVIGGILGHQIGGGTGRDLATVGGAVAGAAVGSQVGRSSQSSGPYTQDVQRCSQVGSGDQIDYWDVTYEFRGLYHRTQMSYQPGPTLTVNADGEPRE